MSAILASEVLGEANILTIVAVSDYNQRLRDDDVVMKMQAYEDKSAFYKLSDKKKAVFILNVICEIFEVSETDLIAKTKTRVREVIYPKMIYCYTVRKNTTMAFSSISDTIKWNHESVRHSCRSMSRYLELDSPQGLAASFMEKWKTNAPKFLL